MMADSDNEKIQEPASHGPGLADFLPDTSNGYIATAGTALANPVGEADPIAVEDALKSVHDPEIPVNIYDLGLVYTIDISDQNEVGILMTLTAPGCPVAGEMPGWVQDAQVELSSAVVRDDDALDAHLAGHHRVHPRLDPLQHDVHLRHGHHPLHVVPVQARVDER